jgi:hypothetical protein
MSASIAPFPSIPSAPAGREPAPALGAARRSLAALAAVALLVTGLSTWTHLDTTEAQQTATAQSR